jgi:hypothetical protein
MGKRSSLMMVFAIASCGGGGPSPDANDLAMASGDAGGCVASTPPTTLYEDNCGNGVCYIDHQPTDRF